MMEPRTYEGTWEEIARHADELAGRKVRLTVLDVAPSPLPLEEALAELLQEAEALATSLPSRSASTAGWEEGVVEKYRRQGFTL